MERNRQPRLSTLANRTTWLRRGLAWALLPVLSLIFVSPASAGGSGDWDWIKFPTVTVASDGDEYTNVVGAGHGWEARFIIDFGVFGRIKSWGIYPFIANEANGDTLSFELYKASKSYPFGKRPKKVHRPGSGPDTSTSPEPSSRPDCGCRRSRRSR